MKLSVIIVNYNVRHFLEQALNSAIKASHGIDMEIFVVDNNSADGSVDMVRAKFPNITLIANDDNPGFSIANNQAIRQSTGEYVLLLNPDTVVEEDTFSKCIAFMDANPDAGGLGVRMIDGSGAFLPESKRGFPSPFAAFCKMVGLSKLFPKSRLFNQYTLGYLDEFETNEVDVLAGAFMWMRKSVLDDIGLLDEDFFMYGEDIDLSYRIVQGGYKNYYFPQTSILHYKGESTKKGSLNYVKAFYNAMIIFTNKHFQGAQVQAFVALLHFAIYFKGTATLVTNFIKRTTIPVIDAAFIFTGLIALKSFWSNYHFHNTDYFNEAIVYTSFPLYVAFWVTSLYFSGGYDKKIRIGNLVRGLIVGTILLTAFYGLLPAEFRTSRMLILLGAVWAIAASVGIRCVLHFIRHQNLDLNQSNAKNLVIVGSIAESERVRYLLHEMHVRTNYIGTVNPEYSQDDSFLGEIEHLREVSHTYSIDEVIFCGKDIPVQQILHWMTALGTDIEFKIVAESSNNVIGSSNKNTAGELYTIDIKYQIAEKSAKRAKRLTDIALSGFVLITLPIQLVVNKNRKGLLKNLIAVISGVKSWVEYAHTDEPSRRLPKLKQGILSPLDKLQQTRPEGKSAAQKTINHLNFLYAKNYHPFNDVGIFWAAQGNLGRG